MLMNSFYLCMKLVTWLRRLCHEYCLQLFTKNEQVSATVTSEMETNRRININTCNVGQNPQCFLAKMGMLRAKKRAEHMVQVLVLTQELKLIIRCTADNVAKTPHHWGHHLVTIKYNCAYYH